MMVTRFDIDPVAAYGALTGTAALIIHYLTYRRDRADIRITIQRNRQIVGGTPQYDPNELYMCVNVANRGRRPVVISQVSFKYLSKRGGAILSDSMIYGSRKLSEGKSADFLMKEADVDFSQIAYFAVFDATRREYRKYVAPLYKRVWYWILGPMRVKKGS